MTASTATTTSREKPALRTQTSWKAITRDRFGSPDVLSLRAIARPQIPTGEVLVEVRAAGVNRGDALEMRGWPYLARVMGYGVRNPRHPVLGTDLAGTMIATSAGVSGIDIGDEVVGFGGGAFAEIARMPASTAAHRPDTISTEEAAAMPTTAVAALQAIRDAARVEPHSGRYDVIIDLVGNQPIRSLRRALAPTGAFVVVGGQNPKSVTGMRRFAAAAAMSPFTRQRLVPLFSNPNRDDLDVVIELARTGAVRPIVGRTFELSETAEAIRHIETGHGTGRTVVTT